MTNKFETTTIGEVFNTLIMICKYRKDETYENGSITIDRQIISLEGTYDKLVAQFPIDDGKLFKIIIQGNRVSTNDIMIDLIFDKDDPLAQYCEQMDYRDSLRRFSSSLVISDRLKHALDKFELLYNEAVHKFNSMYSMVNEINDPQYKQILDTARELMITTHHPEIVDSMKNFPYEAVGKFVNNGISPKTYYEMILLRMVIESIANNEQ